MPQVSVLLTSYNHAPFLREAIDSVLAQSFKDFELIIWDDHSTDDSWDIIQSYADPRIKAFQNPGNMGPVFGVNKAIFEVATGEYFAMHHSDDVWVEDKLEKQLACFAQNPNVAAVFTDAQAIAEEGFQLDDEDHFYSRAFQQPNRTRYQWLRHFLLHGNALCHPSVLIRRSVYAECGGYSEALWQLPDFDMWVRLLLKHEIHVMPEKLVKFRVLNAEANTSGNRPDSRMQWAFEFPHVLNHYRALNRMEVLALVLPEAEEYNRSPFSEIEYALARTVLRLSEIPAAQLFALNLLLEQLQNIERRDRIRNIYGFGALDFAQLTRQYDVYRQQECQNLAITEQALKILNEQSLDRIKYFEWYVPILEQKIIDLKTAIRGLEHSISWRVSSPVRWGGWLARSPRWLRDHLRQLAQKVERAGGISKFIANLRAAKPELKPAPNPGVGSGVLDRNDYAAWVELYDTLDHTKVEEIRAMVAALTLQPNIVLFMQVSQPNPQWLASAIESIKKQIYPHWQLIGIVEEANAPSIKAYLKAQSTEDSRIHQLAQSTGEPLAQAINRALGNISEGWLAVIGQQDIIPAHALALMVQSINLSTDAAIVYSDQDRIDTQEQRTAPYFKPDWNSDLFLAQNILEYLTLYRIDHVAAMGGMREGFEGAESRDLALRIVERLRPGQIVHVPKVLYHQRETNSGTGQEAMAEQKVLSASRKAVAEHLDRIGVSAVVQTTPDNHLRIQYRLPQVLPLVSLIIPTRNALALVKQCIESTLQKTTYSNYEILLIDNASDDPEALAYFEQLKHEPKIRVIRDERPFNYSVLNNSAVEQAKGELVALINNDIEVISTNWLEEMVGIAIQPGVGAVGARLWYPDDTLQHGGVVMGIGGCAGHAQKHLARGGPGYNGRGALIQSYSAVTAACLLVKKERYLKVGGLNEKHLTVAFNDVDFCLKLREAGYRNIWTPYAELYHHESATRGKENTPEKQERAAREISYMQRRWRKIIAKDPAYSPNLTICHEDFSLAWPPRG
jgi:glycosyltransferase involved in cell wall biosynthesis